MLACTFFGHRDTPQIIEPCLRSVLIDLIENKKVNMFYLGNQGSFDYLVRKNLELLKHDYPHIGYAVVLAYMPVKKDSFDCEMYSDTIFPEGLENTPPKYAISKRNKWMIDKSDYVVSYVTNSFGGAAQFAKLAEKKGKTVINLGDLE